MDVDLISEIGRTLDPGCMYVLGTYIDALLDIYFMYWVLERLHNKHLEEAECEQMTGSDVPKSRYGHSSVLSGPTA